jgi:3-oxoacyl-[acyl-carrier protein] reductase
MADLSNRVALVTGGSRGIGAAIANRLATDGAAVAITYASSPAKAEEVSADIVRRGGKAVSIQADNGNPEAVKRAVQLTVEQLGGLDILVNNAGIVAMGHIDEISEADFERILDVNVRGVFYATQEAVKHMRAGGRIINIGSINSDFIPFAQGSLYAMTKAAIAGFTRGLARDLGPRGITVNNIQPGPVETDMNPADSPFAQQVKSFIAVGRYGRVDEIAALVSHIAGAEGAYINGAQIKIDGGFTA